MTVEESKHVTHEGQWRNLYKITIRTADGTKLMVRNRSRQKYFIETWLRINRP
jgi:hypothetical protein